MANLTQSNIKNAFNKIRPVSVLHNVDFEQTITQRMQALHIPSISIAIISKNKQIYTNGFGTRIVNQAAPVNSETAFQAASLSKPICALLIMQQVELGRLDLDQDVNHYLKTWQIPQIEGLQSIITLRMLLSHSSGLPVNSFPGYPAGTSIPTLHQILQGIPPANTAEIKPNIISGINTRYSGGGYCVAQLILEELLQKSFSTIATENLFKPLHMKSSTFETSNHVEYAKIAAHSHDENGIHHEADWNLYPEAAAAGMWTTPSDLLILAQNLIKTLDGETTALSLTQNNIQQMLNPQLPLQHGVTSYSGLGFGCSRQADEPNFGHSGANKGYKCSIRVFPKSKTAIAVMTNSDNGDILISEIISSLNRHTDAFRTTWQLADDDIVGTYKSNAGLKIEIQRSEQQIFIKCAKQPAIALHHCGGAEFTAKSLDIYVTFSNSGQKTPSLTLSQSGRDIQFILI